MEYEDRYRPAQRPKYDCLLFDLDDTLYPLSAGLAVGCRRNIEDYMIEKLGIDKRKVPDLCNLLYKNYGTTMAGLRAIGYDFNYDEYHSFVHGRLPYENLKPDPVLRTLLLGLPIRKVVSILLLADNILKNLGVELCSYSSFFLLYFRSSQMRIRSTPLKLLVDLGWKTVLKGLFALRL
uniref:Pyridoxal phosphatase n=1 Tax=Davidia involucrata TaxID=16924 RepID=A0A5B6Z777_DAVIN